METSQIASEMVKPLIATQCTRVRLSPGAPFKEVKCMHPVTKANLYTFLYLGVMFLCLWGFFICVLTLLK